MQFRVVNLNTGRYFNVGCSKFTLALLTQVCNYGLVIFRRNRELLDVQDNLGDILGDSGNSAELMQNTVDTNAGNSGAGNGGQQGATEGVTHGVAKARLKGLDGEARTVRRYDLFSQSGALCNKHFVSFR